MKSDTAAPCPCNKAWQLRILLPLALTSITLLFPLAPALADTPPLSLQFYGTVSNNATVVGAGYSVVAKINGVQKSSATTDSQGRYGYSPLFLVSCTAGQVIRFFVNGKVAAENITCSAAPTRQLDLHVTGAPATTIIITTILGKSENVTLIGGRLVLGRELSSTDGRVRLKLADNTSVNLKGATTLFAASETNPRPAADNSTALRAYVFAPAGATFSSAATLKLKYELAWLPAGVSESSLYIATWNGSAWTRLSSSCNTTANLVSAPVYQLATFSIRAPKATPPPPVTRVVNTNILGKSENITLSGDVLKSAKSLSSADGRISVALAENTTVDLRGSQQVTVIQLASPPAAPVNVKMIEAYSFDPDGASFSPGATLSIKYTPANLPAGVEETGLYLAMLSNSNWTEVPSTVNAQADTLVAALDHFYVYALLGRITAVPPPPPTPPPTPTPPATTMVAADLAVSPQVAVQGEQVTVSVRVANSGTASDNQTIILKIDDKNEAQKTVILEPGKSQVVTFNLSRSEPGTYRVAIGNLTASFEIKAGTVPAPVAGPSWPVLIIIALGGLLLLIFIISLVFKK